MIVSSRVKELERIVKNCHANGFRAGISDGKESSYYGIKVLQIIKMRGDERKKTEAEKTMEFLDNYKSGVLENLQTESVDKVFDNGAIVIKRTLLDLPQTCKECDANKACYEEGGCTTADKKHYKAYSLRKM